LLSWFGQHQLSLSNPKELLREHTTCSQPQTQELDGIFSQKAFVISELLGLVAKFIGCPLVKARKDGVTCLLKVSIILVQRRYSLERSQPNSTK
jgi:hypothetical protein